MNSVSRLGAYWANRWQVWTVAERTSVLAALAASVLLVAGVAWWASRPEYVMLANRLPPQDAAEVVSALDAAGITYQLNFAGSAVLVPRSTLNAARLAVGEVVALAPGETDSELDSGLWADPAVTQVRLQRDQELRLARSIARVEGVRSATVHLTRPEYSPFIRDRGVPKASVVLDLEPGTAFSAADARGIVSLVAHGVESLDVEHVSVMDTSGRHLSAGQPIDGDITGRLEFRHHLETQLAAKAETMLAQWLGPGRAVVRVTADVDFTETKREEVTFDPDGKVKIDEFIETTTISEPVGGNQTPGAGTAANLGSVSGRPSRTGGTATLEKIERNETRYENASIKNEVTEAPGKIRRLTIAAVIQSPAASEEGEQPNLPDKAAVEAIVKQAVGFDEDRNDGIEVLLAETPVEPPTGGVPAPTDWERIERLLRAASLGVAALVALVCGWLVVRRLSPVVVEVPSDDGLSVEAAAQLAELAQRARQHPQAAARVLAAWLDEPEQNSQTSADRKAA